MGNCMRGPGWAGDQDLPARRHRAGMTASSALEGNFRPQAETRGAELAAIAYPLVMASSSSSRAFSALSNPSRTKAARTLGALQPRLSNSWLRAAICSSRSRSKDSGMKLRKCPKAFTNIFPSQ
eukprot:Skav226321  [mRNA]  locus=scaffold3301:635041:636860:+ [translate_table: standard]